MEFQASRKIETAFPGLSRRIRRTIVSARNKGNVALQISQYWSTSPVVFEGL
jgi:hypothetical protein